MTKKDVAWLFAVITLALCLVVSIILGVTGFFSSATFMHSSTDLKVGDEVSIAVKPNQASVASFTFDGAFFPGEILPQLVQINAQNLSADLRVRVKAQIFGADENFEFVTTSHFQQEQDGYYYFDDVLHGGSKITFCTHLLIPEQSEFSCNEKYILSVIVETLETKFDENVWNDAL